MKVHIAYDDEGNVDAISHPIPGKKEGSTILARFDPLPGQHTATVEVPAELEHLKPRELHDSVRLNIEWITTPRTQAQLNRGRD